MSTEFTIIIPIYNEEDNLIRLEETMNQYLSKSIKQTEILLINDGSKDKSLALMKEICSRNQAFHYISFDKNYGLSAAIKAASGGQ